MCQFIAGSQSHRNFGRAKALNGSLCVVVSLWLLIGPTLSLGSVRLAKAIQTQGQPPIQTERIPVAVLNFQDDSGAGASDEFCQRLGEHLMKELYAVPNRTITPKSVTRAGVEWTQERLSALGKKMGVQFVVHSGLLGVSSDSAGGMRTSRAQVYADIFSVKSAVMKRVEAEGVGAQKVTDYDADIQLGSADFRSREFHNTSVGQALSKAIEQLAALIHQEIGSGGVAPDQKFRKPLEDNAPDQSPQDSSDVPLSDGQDDPGATEEAQEAQADEELQQLIAQAQECLNGLNAARDGEKINALIEALKGLTSALETKAGLLEQGNTTGADQVDQQIDAHEQELQNAVDQSLPQDQLGDEGSSDADSGSGGGKFDQVVRYVEFGFSVLEKILDLRARIRGFTQDIGDPYTNDSGQGAEDTPIEQPLVPVNGDVTEDDPETQGGLTVKKPVLSLAAPEAGENARGLNIAGLHLKSWMPSGTSRVGVVTTVAGRRRPVAGAEIIEPDSGASTRTDNSGFFSLRVPARSTKLIVRKGGATLAEVAIHIVRGRPTVADIQLGRSARSSTLQCTRVLPSSVVVNGEGRNTGTIRGVITDAKGQPVPRALVDVRGLAMARTDSQGSFSFTKVPTGLQQLTVRASDSESRSEQVRVKSNETTESRIQLDLARRIPMRGDRLITPGAGSVLRGRVTDNQNRPVPGAKISAVSTAGSGGSVSVRSRADGSFELGDLKPGSYRVLVDKVGLAAASQSVSLRGDNAPPLDFRLNKDATSRFRPGVEEALARNLGEVRGQVRTKNGAPIPNAWVQLNSTGRTTLASPQRTNARGKYVLKALPGRYELRVRAKDYQETSRPVTVQAHDPRRENFDLKLTTDKGREEGRLVNGALTGRVTDTSTHAPISGAIVSVTGKSATTDRAGNYSIGSVPVGRQKVNVAKSGYSDEARTIDVRAGSTSVNFDLRPAGGGAARRPNETGQLRGRVTDEKSGGPIPGARVTIQGRSDTTDQAGNYMVSEVPEGRHQVSVASGGYENERESVEVRAGSSTNKNFTLKSSGGSGSGSASGSGSKERSRETGQLRGRVTDEKSGRPISGAQVTIQGRSDTTDQAGNYLVTELPEGRHQVSVASGGYENEREAVEVRAGSSTNRNFTLKSASGSGSRERGSESRERPRETGQLRGRVTDERTGKPISGARVTTQGRSDTTDQAGNYVVTDLPGGRQQVSVTSGGYENEKEAVEVRAGSSTNKNFALKSGSGSGSRERRSESSERSRETGQLRGRVTDERTGKPISGARVTTQGRNDTTDQAGNYVVTELLGGRHQVSVTSGGYKNQREAVEVRAGSSTNRNFTLKSASGSGTRERAGESRERGSESRERSRETGQLRGRVTDEKSGRPISGARVTIQGRSDTTDRAGNYVVSEVPGGRHQVSVTSGGYANERESVEVRAGSSTNKNFTLKSTSGSRSKEHQRGTSQLKRRVSLLRFSADAVQ